MEGYDQIYRNTKLTCSEKNSNKIASQSIGNEFVCKTSCDNEEKCAFFFVNEDSWCATYKSCNETRTTGSSGSTYKKLSQEGIVSNLPEKGWY